MNQEMIQLAEHAVATTRWQWCEGMATDCGMRVVGALWAGTAAVYIEGSGIGEVVMDGLIPDLTDASTVACMLALYDDSRDLGQSETPDPVYSCVISYGMFDLRTLYALVYGLNLPR